jgi:hypothetical protein
MIGADIILTDNASTALRDYGAKFRRGAQSEMERFGQDWTRRLVSERLSGRPGVKRRTGNLARSFKSRTFDSRLLGAIVLDVQPEGPGSEYAHIQEFGGTIRPKRAKNLWIPIAGNLTPAGVARITPTEAINRGGFFAKGIFFGKPLVGKGKAQAAPVPLFVLKKSVTVKGRMGASTLWAESMPSLTARLDAVASALAKGGA